MDILLRADLKISLLKSYVDDIRQACTMLRMGMRFQMETKTFRWRKDWEQEDLTLEQEGETGDARMQRLCHPAMEAINPDLKFTVEKEEEFEDNKIPTLDFKEWLLENGHLNHTYYEKPMKNQILLMKRSAMSTRQKYTILANELCRRLSNCNMEGNPIEEKIRIIEEFTRQIKNSGFKRAEAREIVVSGIKGWKSKHARRKEDGMPFYRSAKSTLAKRYKKKLTEKSNWWKEKNTLEKIDEEQDRPDLQAGERGGGGDPKVGEASTQTKKSTDRPMVRSVMFVPFTWDGILVKRLRSSEERMAPLTNWRVKFVERAGVKLQDMLHTSNPWQGEDCGREKCMLDQTKMETGKLKSQSCTRRSVVYETHCESCYERECEEIDQKEIDEKSKEQEKKEIKKYIYIGESARSVYERLWEHQDSLEQLSPDSHMIKHIVEMHPGERDK